MNLSYVKLVAEEIANLKGISYEEVAQITTKNAKKPYLALNKKEWGVPYKSFLCFRREIGE